MSEYVRFDMEGKSPSGKTSIWGVRTNDGVSLGAVKWYASWRQYAFFPGHQTIFEEDCLRAIADFCQRQTSGHREHRRAS